MMIFNTFVTMAIKPELGYYIMGRESRRGEPRS